MLRAGRQADSAADVALESLCKRYWFPLYAFVRRRVATVEEAQDLTQEFFARLLEKEMLASASPERGKFRSFLLTAMKNFLANEWDRAQTQKRGGGHKQLSLNWAEGESRLGLEPAHELTPERLFERQWALTLLDHVVSRLQAEFVGQGQERQFELLKGALTGKRSSYADIAVELAMTEEAARQAAHRLRKRYRVLLRDEILQTVADPSEVDEEIRRLFETLQK